MPILRRIAELSTDAQAVINKVAGGVAKKANYAYMKLSSKLDDFIEMCAKYADNANFIKVIDTVSDADGMLMLKTSDMFDIGFEKYPLNKVDEFSEAAVRNPDIGDVVDNIPAETENIADHIFGADDVNGRTNEITDAYKKDGKAGVDDCLADGKCFTAETLISTDSGLIRIENIKTGDRVYSFDSQTGGVSVNRVLSTEKHPANEIVHIGISGSETINATPEHPFYVPAKGWTSAVNLRAGDVLYTLNGEYVIVEQVQHEILEKPVWVYNFEVSDEHTYFVGENAVGVHNDCPVIGKAHGIEYHRGAIKNKVDDLKKIENVSKIYQNKSLNTVGLKGNQRPDIVSVSVNEGVTTYTLYEFASPTQSIGSHGRKLLDEKTKSILSTNPNTDEIKVELLIIEWGEY
jgi:hypothetical protein